MYKRQAPSVEHRVTAPAVGPATITPPNSKAEEKKYAADDLEVPSFLRRR